MRRARCAMTRDEWPAVKGVEEGTDPIVPKVPGGVVPQPVVPDPRLLRHEAHLLQDPPPRRERRVGRRRVRGRGQVRDLSLKHIGRRGRLGGWKRWGTR